MFLAQFCTKKELSEHVLCDDVFAILNSLRDWGDYSIYPFNNFMLLINLDLVPTLRPILFSRYFYSCELENALAVAHVFD